MGFFKSWGQEEKEDDGSYCFHTGKPVKVVVHNREKDAYKLEDSTYEQVKSRYPKGF